MEKVITHKSPKNKFKIEFYAKSGIKGLGSSFIIGVMTLEGLTKNDFYKHYNGMIVKNGGGSVTIKENKKTYPSFKWKEINNYKI